MVEQRSFDCYGSEMRRTITLVEASAGTGKTFSIGMVVLRAVAELGIPVNEILVVTFTIAATEELKQRIRMRLSAARSLLKQLVDKDAQPDDEPPPVPPPLAFKAAMALS